jgi:hypothetical protein
MPKPAHQRPRTISFEEIPPRLRPQALAAYLRLLDEGYDPERITFRDHSGLVRVVGATPDGRPGTSRPTSPDRIAPEAARCDQPLSGEQITARVREREGDLRALIGRRVRIRWPNGHERTGVVRDRDSSPAIFLEDPILLHTLEDATALDVLGPGFGFKPAATTSDWAAR